MSAAQRSTGAFASSPSGLRPIHARGGMCATCQPLASQAGLAILRAGGNAVDAAVAMAAALTVLEPTSNGIGGDAFALIWREGGLYGLNASGGAPMALSLDALPRDASGKRFIDPHGWESVTVPGAPAAWAALSGRFGRLPFERLFADAIRYARHGYPVSPTVARYWERAVQTYTGKLRGERYRPWFETFAPSGAAPQAGGIWRSEAHAATLEGIARTGAESFYNGPLARALLDYSEASGGYLSAADLATFQPEWVSPLSVPYRGHEVWELPPNGQGLVALQALGMLANDELAALDPIEAAHRKIEALKLAFADSSAYLADPRAMGHSAAALLDAAYLARRRGLIGASAALPEPGHPERGGTVYLATADSDGCMVSYIQSNYMGFGSGLVVPGTGIALHNRGCNFSLEPEHPNALRSGKRPYHTIMPGFLSRAGKAVGPFGVMGGFMQPQGHLQVMSNCLDLGLDPQAALDAPRFQWIAGRMVQLEPDADRELATGLEKRGHEIRVVEDSGSFGRGQIIWRDEAGVYIGGTEKRADGAIAAY